MPIPTETLRRLAACLIVAATAYAEDAARFTGKWEGEHSGQKYLVLTVEAGAPLKMTLTTAVIKVDETGEISEIGGPVQHREEVLESNLEDGRLRFRTRQDDGSEIRYELRVEGDGTALLRLVDEPDWVKPFRLKRS